NGANYELVNLSQNEEVNIRTRVRNNNPVTHDEAQVFIDLDEPLSEDDVYELTVSDLTDRSGNKLENDPSVIIFTLAEARNQTTIDDPIEEISNVVYSFNGTHHEVRIEFDQAPDENSANDIRKYYIEGLGFPYEVAD